MLRTLLFSINRNGLAHGPILAHAARHLNHNQYWQTTNFIAALLLMSLTRIDTWHRDHKGFSGRRAFQIERDDSHLDWDVSYYYLRLLVRLLPDWFKPLTFSTWAQLHYEWAIASNWQLLTRLKSAVKQVVNEKNVTFSVVWPTPNSKCVVAAILPCMPLESQEGNWLL